MLNYSDNDFIGFSFDDHHFEGFNVIHVSDGDRYHEILSPNFQDKTLAVNGVDETYYFYTNFTQRPISVTIAFDKVTDADIRSLRRVLYPKAMGALKFDETPFKEYQVKVQSPPQLDYICFLENGKRVYKGEGILQFVAYYPYGICTKKYLEEYGSTAVEPDWNAQAGLLTTNTYQPTPQSTPIPLDVDGEAQIYVYNAGDIPTDYILRLNIFSPSTATTTVSGGITLDDKYILNFENLPLLVPEQGNPFATYCVDSRSQLFYQIVTDGQGNETLILANEYLTNDLFSKIAVSDVPQSFDIICDDEDIVFECYITYNYLYL